MRARSGDPGSEGLLDVEIVEDGAVDAAAGHGPAPGATRGPEPTAPRPGVRRTAWAAVAAVLALVIGVNVVEARRAAAEEAALAALPGVVGSLEHPVHQVWASPATYPVVFHDEVMVAQTMQPTPMIEAVDVRTGERLWQAGTELAAERYRHCSPWHEWGEAPVDDAEVTSLVCETGSYAMEATEPSSVELVDIRSGDVLATFEVGGRLLSYERRGDDLLAVWVAPGREVVAVRLRTDGAEAWRTTSEPVGPDVDLSTLGSYVEEELLVAEQLATTDGEPATLMALDVDTGAPAAAPGRARERSWVETVETGAGYRMTVRQTRGSTRTVVQGDDGASMLEVDGWPLLAAVDDGSAPEVVLVKELVADGPADLPPGARVTAFDVDTGERLWSSTETMAFEAVLRIRGEIVVVAGGRARAIDVRTGTESWTVDRVSERGAVTDGRRVLLVRTDDGGGLSSHDLREGTELWRTTLPGVEQLTPGPGVVVVQRNGTLAAFR